MGANQTTPSTYEFKSQPIESQEAERFFYAIYDAAQRPARRAGAVLRPSAW